MFSIVIPLFNKAHSIERTLKTVFEQTYGNFEIVIVDDGSTDNGIDVIKSFTNDSRLRLFSQTNQGVSVARNKGVEFANRDYIAFLDGDDEWHNCYLEKIKEAIEKYPKSGMICTAGIVRNADGTEFYRLAKKYRDQVLEVNFFENPHVFLHTSATVVRKDQFERTIGFPVGMRRNQDYALFFSLAIITQVVYCGYPLSIYVGGVAGQATSTPFRQVLYHIVNRFNLVYQNWKSFEPKNDVFIIFMKYELRHLYLTCLRTKDYESINYLASNLSPDIMKLFSNYEKWILRHDYMNRVAIFNILATKVRWRLNRYPYFGE